METPAAKPSPPAVPPPVTEALARLPRAPAACIRWLDEFRDDIVSEWVDRVARLSPHYRARSTEELSMTISQSFQANRLAMESGSTAPLDSFVEFITRLRLEAGFSLSEVQEAFDLFRVILLPRIMACPPLFAPLPALESLSAVVSYQIHRFSDKFQHRHEEAIRRHAENLKKEVALRSRELAASERQHKTLVEEINDGYVAVQDMRVALANRAFCEMHQATWRQTVSQPFLDFVAPDDRDRVLRVFRQTLAGGPASPVLEYLRIDQQGQRGVTEIRARAVDLGQGPVIIGICRDITERVEMERKVRESEHLAYVGHLAASLSHELRNPLSIIKVNLQVLSRQDYLPSVDRQRLEMAVTEVSRLEGILRQLLDVAKPLALNPAPHDPTAVVQGCLDLLRPKLAERGIRLRRLLEPDLGELMLDQGKLEQALFNLLLNAMDAVADGGYITVRSRESQTPDGPAWELSVRDNGAGMSPEDLAQIFTPFFTKKVYGTGLGLTNVKRIAEAHGGGVAVESTPGKGSRFSLILPRHP